jgi:acetyl-CoA carboxylase biotin carboxyl carrier protein
MSQDAVADRGPVADGAEAAPVVTRESEVRSVLELVRGNAVQLLSALQNPPSALRIHAGGVVVEAEWPATPSPAVNGTAVNGTAVNGVAPLAPAPPAGDGEPAADSAPATHAVRAPVVGVFFRAPEPGAKPFVDVGDSVTEGQQVAIVEIMKLMVPVHADVSGTVVEVLKENGEHVEYDEPLFAVSPS